MTTNFATENVQYAEYLIGLESAHFQSLLILNTHNGTKETSLAVKKLNVS